MATSNELIGRVLGGRYRLRALVGTGASARVYLAEDTTLRRQVAVKVLHESLAHDETFLRRFRKEAQAAAALNHPNVLAVYDWGQEDVPYIVTEYLSGGSLRSMLDAGHRLSLSQALLVGLEATRGLEYAHRRGLVHRDIKPANLLFDDERRLRIADFGLARALAEAGVTEPAGSIVGTVRYASPEQAKGAPLTGRTDVYSLALVLIECVTGEVPFGSDTTLGTLLARVDQQLPVPAAMGPLRPALERAGRPDPADRPDAEEFAIALMAAAEDLRRPEPLPIVGAIAGSELAAMIDPTLVHTRPAVDDVPALFGADATSVMRTSTADPTTALATLAASEPVDLPPSASATAWPHLGPGAAPAEPPAERHRRRWPWVLLGILLLAGAASAGVYAYLENRTISVVMPALVGQGEQQLIDLAAEHGWQLVKNEDRSDDVEAGQLISVAPPEGTRVADGETVEYTVSIGKKLVAIPKLVGKTLDEARADLAAVNLTLGEPTHAFDENVVAGRILAVETVGTAAEPKATIIVKVSDGPPPRTVPAELVGQPEAAVVAKLAELKLQGQRMEEFSDTVAQGSVTRFEPAAGTAVPRDSAVQFFVSKGKEPKAIPNVFGLGVIAAAQKLREAGFEPGNTIGAPDRPVIATDPVAGQLRVPGTKVDIITGSR